MKSLVLVLLCSPVLFAACSSSDSAGSQPQSPVAEAGDSSLAEGAADQVVADQGVAEQGPKTETGTDVELFEAQAEATLEASLEAEASLEGGKPTLQEQEPNNGGTKDEYNPLPLGAILQGSVDPVGDPDLFRFDATAGKVYHVVLEMPSGTELRGHLTAMDDGRSGDPAGDDYVKMVRGDSGSISIDLLAMGQGGYFVIVRDSRNVEQASVGGAGFKYRVSVEEREAKEVEAPALTFPANFEDSLAERGGIRLYPFDASPGTDLLVDLKAKGDLDGRLLVFAKSTGDWIARNDDRSASDPNPLIDAPLTESGGLWLVVENISETAQTLTYTLQASLP